jgi:hypothetical protein
MSISKEPYRLFDKNLDLRSLIIGGLLTILIYFFIAWFILEPGALWSPDEGAKLMQIKSFHIEDGQFLYNILYPGIDLDPELHYALSNPKRDLFTIRAENLYFQRLPTFPLLTYPFFKLLKLYGLYILPAICGGLTVALSMRLLDVKDRNWKTWLLIAFGSPVFIYSVIFWEHTVSTALGLMGALLGLQITIRERGGWRRSLLFWGVVGGFLGASTYLRMEMVIFVLACLLALGLISPGQRGGIIFAGIIVAGMYLLQGPLHGILFSGQTVPDNAEYVLRPARYLSRAGWQAIPDLLIGPSEDWAITPGWLGWVWSGTAIAAVVLSLFRGERRVPWQIRSFFWGVTAVAGVAFLVTGEEYHSIHGILLGTPWVLLGICRAPEIYRLGGVRARFVALLAILGLVGYIIGIIVFRDSSPHGGLEWGARFFLVYYPLFGLITLWETEFKRGHFESGVIIVLVLLGFGFQLRGLQVIRHDKQINAVLNKSIQEIPEDNIVSDLWWLTVNAAPLPGPKSFFVTGSPEELGGWIALAHANQVDDFALVSINPLLPSQASTYLGNLHLELVELIRVENLSIFRLRIVPEH